VSPCPLLIAQITDPHIKPPGELAYGRVDTAAALSRAVEALNAFSPRPDLVVISGDIADTPLEQEYAHARTLLAPLRIPYVAIPGNHDSRALMRAAMSAPFAQGQFAQDNGPLNSLHPVGGLDIVLIDSTVPGAAHGELDAATLDWLDATLAASASRPALLFLHHPPFVCGIGYMDRIMLRNAEALAGVLRRHPRARMLACGHVHRAAQTSFAGIAASICPAGNQACALDLEGRWPEVFTIEPPAFHLHTWFPADDTGHEFGHVVTHLVPIGDVAGPYRFDTGEKIA
jgi:3',5'-cyclic AMP phosphodiesterase CpdA